MHMAHGLNASLTPVTKLGDDELIANVKRLLREEHELSAHLLVHLGEVDARQLYRQHAYSSMFEYCVQALHLSEAEAYLRIGAARTGRRFPDVLQMLAAGELHLSALKLLAPLLDETNCEELLSAARFKSKRDVELLLAKRREKPDVPNVIRKLPQPGLAPEPAGEPAQPSLLPTIPVSGRFNEMQTSPAPDRGREAVPALPREPTARPTLSQLSANRYKVQLTASQQLHDKLRQAQDLMRHELPNGDLAIVIERAMDLLIAERIKRRFGQCRTPRTPRGGASPKRGSRHIPHDVRRQVFARDGARCSFISTNGKRCEQRGGLELHHEQPFGRGGPATAANIRLLCRAHNQLLAERDYGREFVRQRIESARDDRHHVP